MVDYPVIIKKQTIKPCNILEGHQENYTELKKTDFKRIHTGRFHLFNIHEITIKETENRETVIGVRDGRE